MPRARQPNPTVNLAGYGPRPVVAMGFDRSWRDSASRINGQPINASWVGSPYGYAASFPGTPAGAVSLGTSLGTPANLSIAALVRIDSLGSGTCTIAANRGASTNWQFRANASGNLQWLGGGAVTNTFTTTTNVTAGNWVAVGVTIDSATGFPRAHRFNGSSLQSESGGTVANTGSFTGQEWAIGGFTQAGTVSHPLTGRMACCLIWPQALSDTLIRRILVNLYQGEWQWQRRRRFSPALMQAGLSPAIGSASLLGVGLVGATGQAVALGSAGLLGVGLLSATGQAGGGGSPTGPASMAAVSIPNRLEGETRPVGFGAASRPGNLGGVSRPAN